MNKCIILAVIAFAAFACASPYNKYSSNHGSADYRAFDNVKLDQRYIAPSAFASAAATPSVPKNGDLYQVLSYDMLSFPSGHNQGAFYRGLGSY